MQRICDGLQTKRDVLDFTIEQYKAVYIKAKREFETVVNVKLPLYRNPNSELIVAVRPGLPSRSWGSSRSPAGS